MTQDRTTLDQAAFCADSTTVNRQVHGAPLARFREEYIRVQGVVSPDAAASVAPQLQRLTGGATIKWKLRSVQEALLAGRGEDIDRLRAALERIPVVVIDPMAPVRDADRTLMEMGHRGPSWSVMLHGSPEDADLRAHCDFVRAATARMVLMASGVGELDSLMSDATANEIGGRGRSISLVSDYAREVRFNHRKAAKLAVQATALTLHEQMTRTVQPTSRWLMREMRFAGGLDTIAARERLRGIAGARLAFDAGEEATEAVARLRGTAEVFCYMDDSEATGIIQTVADGESVRMQVADVVAGYASAVIARDGFVGLVKRFELAVINNARLSDSEAIRWDRERAWHREILARTAR